MRSEFEKYFKENHADSFYSVDAALEMRGDDYIDFQAADLWALWQHRQTEVDELKKRVDIAERKLQLVEECIAENAYSNMRSSGLVIQVAELEQALKGEE